MTDNGGARGRAALAMTVLCGLTALSACTGAEPDPLPSTSSPRKTAYADCVVEPLPLLPDMGSVYVVDGDGTGRYTLGLAKIKGQQASVVWDRDQIQVLPSLPMAGSRAVAVNSKGLVVGSGGGAAWLYRDGQTLPLKAPEGTAVVDINERGDILGNTAMLTGNVDVQWMAHGLIWPASSYGAIGEIGGMGTPVSLADPFPGHAYSSYSGKVITADGTVLGQWEQAQGDVWQPARAVSWDPTGQAAKPLPLIDGSASSWLTNASDSWAVGIEQRPGSAAKTPVIWDLKQGKVQRLPDGSTPVLVTADGWAVLGERITDQHWRFSKWRDGVTQRMAELPEVGGLATLSAVSDDGSVIAGRILAFAAPDSAKAVRWKCPS